MKGGVVLKSTYSRKFTSFILAFVIFVSTFTFAVINASATENNTLSTTTALNLRKEKSTDCEVLTLIPKGATVTLLSDSTDGWAEVTYSSFTGYCSTSYLEPAAGSTVKISGKTTSYVNLRTEKNTDCEVLTVVPENATVAVNDNTDSNWAYVTYNGKTGYISKDYVVVTFTLADSGDTEKPDEDFKYPSPDMSGLPLWSCHSVTDMRLNSQSKPQAKLVLNASQEKLDINETFTLVAYLSGNSPLSSNVTFTSSDSKVASVSSKGVVTALSHGKVTVTATDKLTSESASCVFLVSDNITEIKPTPESTPEPTPEPTLQPTKPTTGPDTGDLTLSDKEITIYVGNEYILKTNSNSTLTWTSSDKSIATVSDGMVVAIAEGTATITAKNSKSSASCKVIVKKCDTSVSISHGSATVTAGKTFLAYSSTSDVTWTSSDTSVATVNNGYILGVAPGKAIVKVAKEGGASTMVVTVTESAPIRFAYTSPNCAQKNSTVTLVAITDKSRSEVKFDVTVGSSTKTVKATSKTADGNNYIWKGTITFDKAGTYSVKAYSKKNSASSWETCSDATTTAFVTSTTDKNTTMCENRRASDEIINLIANYEGFIGSVYADPLTGDPTLGYGRVVYAGATFYNGMTQKEAFAFLVKTVNESGYTSRINALLTDNKIKFNQHHFDALVDFSYNLGAYAISNNDDLLNVLLNSYGNENYKNKGYVNETTAIVKKKADSSSATLKTLSAGDTVLLVNTKVHNSNWYKIQLDEETVGFIEVDKVTRHTTNTEVRNLNNVTLKDFASNYLDYHHASKVCYKGLLYRRIDEVETFFYGDYLRNGKDNKFGLSYSCSSNPSFKI